MQTAEARIAGAPVSHRQTLQPMKQRKIDPGARLATKVGG